MKITRLLAFSVARTGFWVLLAVGTIGVSVSAWVDDRSGSTNSIGMRMIRIPRGTFMMGSLSPTPESLKVYEPSSHEKGHLPHGDWDEHPVHEVTISRDFLISETEVTAEQYRHFAPYYQDAGKYSPYVSGISWEEASAFCEWLSEIEGKPYRLPTEAEWEYACRAGTRTLFSSGDLPPEDGEANPWGVRNMHTGVLEWCLDWYGEYDGLPQSDPIGAVSGLARVVRGGGLQHRTPFYQRSANRGSAPPDFQGQHLIGFRVVQASWPDSVARKVEAPFFQQCVKQEAPRFKKVGEKPYFKRRVILPIPPENVVSEASRAAGFHPGILGHNHSPALEVCPNGDLIAVYFTSVGEGSPDAALIGTRLRYGAEEWDMPELLFDLADVNDVAPLLWNDNGKLHLFWGAAPPGLADLPFWFVSSSDNGATWSGVRFPFIRGRRVLYYGQPISTAFRDRDGTMYVPTDGVGGHSLLWASRDGGVTWFDTGGRTGGRHTCFVLLPDGRI
ncbi:MAG TPA: SUMF1/EgtB/PvdO family nonheme iron enzyme, partial [Acidobacteriota bacterium]|nr:SUMF1/EgtB/PvdO family nonheme iron enzyme [Acidobacteriota bacterium]